MRLRFAILGAGLLAALGVSSASAASGAATFALVPQHYDTSLRVTQSYFVAVAKPATSFSNGVQVRNLGSTTGTAYLYAVDATTGQTSGAVYLDRAKPRRGVGAWVTLGATSVTLAPGESRTVPVTVHVPAGAKAGDHLGGIVAENATVTAANGKGALQIKVRHLTIAAVVVQVPGKAGARVVSTGVHSGGEHGYQYVYVHLKNAGRLATKPLGRLLVADSSGKLVTSRAFELDTFLPRTEIDYPVLLPKRALAPGSYRATVELTYGASALGYRRQAGPTRTTTATFPFTVSSGQYKTVFTGTKPLQQTQPAKSGSSGSPLLLVLAGALAALLAVAVGLVFAVRRWGRQ